MRNPTGYDTFSWRLNPGMPYVYGTWLATTRAKRPLPLVRTESSPSFSALINPQHYEVFIDNLVAGELTGYRTSIGKQLAPGPHSIYVRAYARDSVSITRIYSYSATFDMELSAGERRSFSCGLTPEPPLRKWLIFGGLILSLLLALVPLPVGWLGLRGRYALVMTTALLTVAVSWYGYSFKRGANIYLKEG